MSGLKVRKVVAIVTGRTELNSRERERDWERGGERASVSKQVGQNLIMKGYYQEPEGGQCVGWYQLQISNMCAAFERLER